MKNEYVVEKNILKEFLNGIIVNCQTEEDSNDFLEIIEDKIEEDFWHTYKGNTCYRYKNNMLACSDIYHYKERYPEKKIYKFSEVIKKQGI